MGRDARPLPPTEQRPRLTLHSAQQGGPARRLGHGALAGRGGDGGLRRAAPGAVAGDVLARRKWLRKPHAIVAQVMERAGDSGRAEELRVQNAIAMLLHLCRLHGVALRHMEAKLDDVVDAAFHTCAWRIGRAALDHRATTVEEAARYGREVVLRDAARAHSLRAQAVRAAKTARSVRYTLT